MNLQNSIWRPYLPWKVLVCPFCRLETCPWKFLVAHLFYVITIKLIMCVQEKIECSSMSQRPGLSSTRFSALSLATKIKQQQKMAIKLPEMANSWYSVVQGCHLPPSCYSMATGLDQITIKNIPPICLVNTCEQNDSLSSIRKTCTASMHPLDDWSYQEFPLK